jgi:hypothetical protein
LLEYTTKNLERKEKWVVRIKRMNLVGWYVIGKEVPDVEMGGRI